MQCSQRSPGYWSESGYPSNNSDTSRVDVEMFESGKKTVADTKISGYVWTGTIAFRPHVNGGLISSRAPKTVPEWKF